MQKSSTCPTWYASETASFSSFLLVMVAYPLFYLQLCALGILQAKYLEAVGSQQQVTKVDQQLINSYSNNEKALYESNELRKKGLCLVPISMLINYLG